MRVPGGFIAEAPGTHLFYPETAFLDEMGDFTTFSSEKSSYLGWQWRSVARAESRFLVLCRASKPS